MKSADDYLKEMAEEPTFDRYMQRDPMKLRKDPKAYPAIVARLRAERGLYNIKKRK